MRPMRRPDCWKGLLKPILSWQGWWKNLSPAQTPSRRRCGTRHCIHSGGTTWRRKVRVLQPFKKCQQDSHPKWPFQKFGSWMRLRYFIPESSLRPKNVDMKIVGTWFRWEMYLCLHTYLNIYILFCLIIYLFIWLCIFIYTYIYIYTYLYIYICHSVPF